jgi:hypothetical protein
MSDWHNVIPVAHIAEDHRLALIDAYNGFAILSAIQARVIEDFLFRSDVDRPNDEGRATV